MQNLLTNDHQPMRLAAGKTHAIRLPCPVRVQVSSGLVWMTVEEGGADVWLRPGQVFDFHRRGLAVFEAVKADAEFALTPLPGVWRRLWSALVPHRRPASMSSCATSPAASYAAASQAAASAPLVSRLLPKGLIRWF